MKGIGPHIQQSLRSLRFVSLSSVLRFSFSSMSYLDCFNKTSGNTSFSKDIEILPNQYLPTSNKNHLGNDNMV